MFSTYRLSCVFSLTLPMFFAFHVMAVEKSQKFNHLVLLVKSVETWTLLTSILKIKSTLITPLFCFSTDSIRLWIFFCCCFLGIVKFHVLYGFCFYVVNSNIPKTQKHCLSVCSVWKLISSRSFFNLVFNWHTFLYIFYLPIWIFLNEKPWKLIMNVFILLIQHPLNGYWKPVSSYLPRSFKRILKKQPLEVFYKRRYF